jgi:hypothetical protein
MEECRQLVFQLRDNGQLQDSWRITQQQSQLMDQASGLKREVLDDMQRTCLKGENEVNCEWRIFAFMKFMLTTR